MSEYIEREKLVKHYECCIDEVKNTNGITEDFEICLRACLRALKNQPAADVAEVRHGEWIDDGDCYHCSHCNAAYDFVDVATIEGFHFTRLTADYNYCPNCGAKMDKKECETHEQT